MCSSFLSRLFSSRIANEAFRSSINQRVGRPELGCNVGAYQRSHKTHRRSYKKPSSYGPHQLRVWAVNSASISGQHYHAPITHLAGVSIHRLYKVSAVALISS